MTPKQTTDTSKVLIIIIILMIFLSLCVVGAYFFLKNPTEAKGGELQQPDTYLDLPEIKTTFSSYGVIHAKVIIALEHDGIKKDKAIEKAKSYVPLISASLTSELNSLTPSKLKVDGVSAVEVKARKRINKELSKYQTDITVKEILFQDFAYVF